MPYLVIKKTTKYIIEKTKLEDFFQINPRKTLYKKLASYNIHKPNI